MATTKTNVIGYFNPNEYPLQLSLAEFNMLLQLESKAYVVDRSGRLVNDPVLDRFVGKGKLARASDQKQQVEITLLRPVNDTSNAVAPPAPHAHSVSQASGFAVKDGRVVPQNPVNTAPQPITPPPVSYNPVKGYSVEEAKKLHLIRPTKPVPEDFGADESTGAPKSGQEIPEIRYATDTTRGRKAAPLPAELTVPATPQQAAIITGLERAATGNPDDPNLLGRVTRQVTEAAIQGVPPTTVFPKPVLTEPSAAPAPVKLVPPPIPANPQPTPVVALPAPVLAQDAPESSLVVENELPGADTTPVGAVGEGTDTDARTQAEDRTEVARRGTPPADIETVTCPVCPGKSFANKGLFLRHVRRAHATQEAELMAKVGGA